MSRHSLAVPRSRRSFVPPENTCGRQIVELPQRTERQAELFEFLASAIGERAVVLLGVNVEPRDEFLDGDVLWIAGQLPAGGLDRKRPRMARITTNYTNADLSCLDK